MARPRLKSPLQEDPPLSPGEMRPGEDPVHPQAKTFRISIKSVMILTTIVAVAFAGYGGMRRGGDDFAYYIVFAMVAPLVVLAIAGALHEWTRRKPRR